MTRLELATPRPPDLPELLMNKYYHMDVNCSRGNIQTNIPSNTKLCEVCGERFEYNTDAKKETLYCKKCAKKIDNEKAKERAKQAYFNKKNIKS